MRPQDGVFRKKMPRGHAYAEVTPGACSVWDHAREKPTFLREWVTIMVKSLVLSEYSDNPPQASETGRIKIRQGPLYALERVQELVSDENQLIAWTEKCRKDVHKLFDGDLSLVAELIRCLKTTDYIDSEWCQNGRGALAACDAYSIRRQEVMAGTGRSMPVEYFLKFAIGKTGKLVLTVSCHV